MADSFVLCSFRLLAPSWERTGDANPDNQRASPHQGGFLYPLGMNR
jgi:hypothetical protein